MVSASIFGVVGVPALCYGVDFVGLGYGSVIFPQDKHSIGILAVFVEHSEWGTLVVYQYGGRSGAVERYALD